MAMFNCFYDTGTSFNRNIISSFDALSFLPCLINGYAFSLHVIIISELKLGVNFVFCFSCYICFMKNNG